MTGNLVLSMCYIQEEMPCQTKVFPYDHFHIGEDKNFVIFLWLVKSWIVKFVKRFQKLGSLTKSQVTYRHEERQTMLSFQGLNLFILIGKTFSSRTLIISECTFLSFKILFLSPFLHFTCIVQHNFFFTTNLDYQSF